MISVALLLAYIATVVGANWAIATFGLVPVGLGLMAPAGVYFAGLAFLLRDGVQESAGRGWSVIAVVIGAALSVYLSTPVFALASGVAFLVSEFADLAVYTPLRQRGWLRAVAISNIVGLIVDSALFLWLAFGSLDFLPGQIVGKLWITAAFVLPIWAWRRGRALEAGRA